MHVGTMLFTINFPAPRCWLQAHAAAACHRSVQHASCVMLLFRELLVCGSLALKKQVWKSDCMLQTTHGCGDLIFSSHTTFALVGVLTYTEYGAVLFTKVTRHKSASPHFSCAHPGSVAPSDAGSFCNSSSLSSELCYAPVKVILPCHCTTNFPGGLCWPDGRRHVKLASCQFDSAHKTACTQTCNVCLSPTLGQLDSIFTLHFIKAVDMHRCWRGAWLPPFQC